MPKSALCYKHSRNPYVVATLIANNTQNGSEQKNGSTGKQGRVGRKRAFTDEAAFKAIDELGTRVSVVQLAKTLKCARVTVNDWAHSRGHENLDELVKTRRSGV
jgi:hypothetical protein